MKKAIYFLILILILPSIYSIEWCAQPGYESCIEHTEIKEGINITSRLAINLYDSDGNNYSSFLFSGFAINSFYADVFYSSNTGNKELYYATNITNLNESCDINGVCQGEYLEQTTDEATWILAELDDEYIGCPAFISMACDYNVEWCAWASLGYEKPINNTCAHIRVVECRNDIDCDAGYSCNTSSSNWRDWSCEFNESWTRPAYVAPTTFVLPRGSGNYLDSNSYNPTYTKSDLSPIAIDAIGTIGAEIVANAELIVIGFVLLLASSLIYRLKK